MLLPKLLIMAMLIERQYRYAYVGTAVVWLTVPTLFGTNFFGMLVSIIPHDQLAFFALIIYKQQHLGIY